jgi:uncharacterized membrane protein
MEFYSTDQMKNMGILRMRKNWLNSVAVFIISFFILSSISFIDGYFQVMHEIFGTQARNLTSFAGIQSIIFTGPISYGVALFFLNAARGNEGEIVHVFTGFKRFGTTFLCGLMQTIFIVLWSLLFIIPGIIAAINYSMAYYLLADYKNLSAMDALSMSKDIMKGHKGRYFNLLMSFMGWFVFSAVTLGLGYVYVMPYFNNTIAVFYQDLINGTDTDLIRKYAGDIR